MILEFGDFIVNSFYGSLIILIVASIIIVSLTRTKEHKVTRLEKTNRVLTIVLMFLYIFMSLISVLIAAFGNDYPYHFLGIKKVIWNVASYCAMFMPHISIISICTSVALGKRGKSVASFVVQFLPLILFILSVMTMSLVESTVTIP